MDEITYSEAKEFFQAFLDRASYLKLEMDTV